VNASKTRARLIIASLFAAFLAVMSTSMTASATSSNAGPEAPEPGDRANLDVEEVAPDSESSACLPDGAGCSIIFDRCCGGCLPLVGHAGRCI
jgi:hypothetical protein